MDSQSTTTEIKHHYPPTTPWSSSSRVSSASSTPGHKSLPDKPASYQPQSHLDLLPILFPQHYQAQLLNYNRLISPGRGGGGGLTTPPLPPVVSAPHIQAAPRARSVSKASNKDSQNGKPSGASSNCHGSRVNKNADKSDRAVTMAKDKTSKVPPKQGDTAQSLSARPLAHRASQNAPTQTSSVPSTPHQHARNHSIFPESHETSPTATQNHSPRSAYSETNSTLPSLRPLPPRLGGCKFETALVRGRRRMPYSLGTDRLEKSDLGKIKSKLSEDEERKLTTDMRELYDRLKPTEESRQNRNQFVSKLEKIFNEEWPGHNIGVHLFGSSGNKLYSDDSDVDICITTDWKDLENVCMIAELLAKRGMEKVVCVSSAKVPIVKIWDPELKLACDMNVNNTLALENTRMVLTYVEIDERVRPLAMIIKHWTRRRIINDAAFGGTLSSYTWICMIICFLQLRKPPVLPALHQRPHQKRPAANGRQSEFADDLNKLRGFGKENKETLGELLFHFFKFYAHEFDYDKLALSVRLGKTITKTEKEWHRSINNMLCVEEPFNTVRNLGNTADDTSFRGLHMELRRAYELISEAKFDECCEQYVFPKEEERIWQKPASAPRPILLRSSSQQQQTGRSGRGNYRGGRQFHRNGNNNRRASSSVAYENNPVYTQTSLPIMTPQDLQWYQGQAPNGHYPLHGDIINSALSALQIQEQTLRFQLYTQYTHSQAYAQQQALQHAQRMQGGASSQSGDRSRTNSFDNPPLTAPIRPELYMYPMAVQQAPYFTHAGQGTSFTTYPSSPSTTNGAPEFRRSLHRSSVATDASAPSSTGTMRSQSQPASRSSMPSIPMIPGYPGITGPNGMPVYPTRHASGGGPLPSFIPDESGDSETDAGQTGAITESPTEEESTRYVGYYVTETTPTQQTMPIPNAIPPFADVGQGRRRLSTDQLPQTILDRRMRRASRSPSPLGHSRAFSMGTNSAPLSSAPFAPVGNTLLKEPQKPIVVNGTLGGSARQPSVSGSVASEDIGPYDNPLHISQSPSVNGSSFEQAGSFPAPGSDHSPPYPDRPLVVNGSSSASATPQTPQDYQSFNQRMAYMGFTPSPYGVVPGPALNGMTQVSPMSRQRAVSRQQQNGIAPLDLAVADHFSPEMQHLSPVYETRTPSPTVTRRFDGQATNGTPTPVPTAGGHRDGQLHKDTPKSQQKTSPTETHAKNEHQPHHGHQKHHPRVNGIASRENGHVRAAKSESDHASGWQKPKSRKKGGDAKNAASNQSHGETPPKNDAERKGG